MPALHRWLPLSSCRLLHASASYHSYHLLALSRGRHASGRALSTLSSLRSDDAPSSHSDPTSFADTPPAGLPPSSQPVSLDQLRSVLQSPITSTTTLLSLIQHARSQPSLLDLLTPSDYSLLCHQLSLHNAAHSDYRALTCLLLMEVYDEYCTRERDGSNNGWGAGWRRELMTDALTVCSRTGEGRGCEFVAVGMSFYGLTLTACDMNAVLWGWRFDRGHQWRWYGTMRELSRAIAAGQEPADQDSRTLSLHRALKAADLQSAHSSHWRPDSTTVLIMMHSCLVNKQAADDGFARLDNRVLRRLTTAAFHLPASAPLTTHLFNQLISLSSVIDRDIPLRFSRRVHALFRMANELHCPLTERSLRLAMGAAHILQHRHQANSAVSHGSEVNGWAATEQQQLAVADDESSVDSSWFSTLQSDPNGAQFALDVLAAFQQSGASVGPSSALFFDLHATATTPWQRVLELFDWVQHEGGHIDMQRAMTAIEACYRGKHWQRALDILVLPEWAKKFIHVDVLSRATKSNNGVQREQSQHGGGGHTANYMQSDAGSAVYVQPPTPVETIEWQASNRRWSGPQHDRLSWLTELKDEPWLAINPTAGLLEKRSEVSAVSVQSVAAAHDTASLPLAPLSYPATILHFAYTIAAMDEASNAEAVLKADRLHIIALRLLPFLGSLYQYDTNSIHLHHPLTSLHTVNSFVQQPHNQQAKLFSLLYLVWRIMRRHFVDNSTAVELLRHSALYGSRVHGRWGISHRAKLHRGHPLRIRVDTEAELRILQRLLIQPPFELKTCDNGQIGELKRYKLYELAGNPAKQNEKQPVERLWWKAMHNAQGMNQEVIALELPSHSWYGALQGRE